MVFLFLIFVSIFLQAQAQTFLNPFFEEKNHSKAIQHFNDHFVKEASSYAALSRLGQKPTFDEFQNSVHKTLALFFSLPANDQRDYLKDMYSRFDDHLRQEIENKMFEYFDLENSNDTKKALQEALKTWNKTASLSEVVSALSNSSDVVSKVVPFFKRTSEEIEKLSDSGKAFVSNALRRTMIYLQNPSQQADHLWGALRKSFVRLPHQTRIDIVKKLTWFLTDDLKKFHETSFRKDKHYHRYRNGDVISVY